MSYWEKKKKEREGGNKSQRCDQEWRKGKKKGRVVGQSRFPELRFRLEGKKGREYVSSPNLASNKEKKGKKGGGGKVGNSRERKEVAIHRPFQAT